MLSSLDFGLTFFNQNPDMNKHLYPLSYNLTAFLLCAIILSGCSKSGINSAASQDDVSTRFISIQTYGVLPPDPARYLQVPAYSAIEIDQMLNGGARIEALGPEPVTYTLTTPPVRNQERIGSCTAFAGSETNEILYYYKKGIFPATLSPLYLYYAERVKIQGFAITSDPGAAIIDIPQSLQKYGQCVETSYTYPVNATQTATPSSAAYTTAPSAAAVSNALSYKIGPNTTNYARVNQGDTAAVIALLRNNIPVIIGINIYDNSGLTIFERLTATNYTYSPLTATGALKSGLTYLGGHANVIVGYDNTKKAFRLENSWGTNWASAGYWYLPYSVFQSSTIAPAGNMFWMTL